MNTKMEARNLRQPMLWALTLLTTFALSVGLLTSPAEAATVTVINTDGQGIASRYAPRIAATNGYGAPAGASVNTLCWDRGDAVGPNGNTLWWTISYAGRQFWAADRYLSTPYTATSTPAEPRCSTTTAPAPSGITPKVWIGSPITGTWDLPASAGGDGAAAHHWLRNGATDNGDFAIDLITPHTNRTQAVYLYAAPQDAGVSIAARVDRIGAACGTGTGGSFVTVGIYTGGTRIGSVTYAHLANLRVSTGQTIPRWGTLLGSIGDNFPRNVNCWTGPHVHTQVYDNKNYACFNGGFRLGQALNRTNFIGFMGGNVASAARQPCR